MLAEPSHADAAANDADAVSCRPTDRVPGTEPTGAPATRITNASSPEEQAANATLLGITIRTATGNLVEHTMRDAARLDLAEGQPIRRPMAYQGQPSKPGYHYMTNLDTLVSYESRLEMSHLMWLARDRDVVAVIPQPFRLHWQVEGGRRRGHVPDFYVLRRDGHAEVLDVKGSRAAQRPDNALVFAVTARACDKLRVTFRLAHEIDAIVAANLRWLDGYTHLAPLAGTLAPDILDAVHDQTTPTLTQVIDAATAASNANPLHVRATVFFLLWAGDLHCDMTRPFNESMTLRLGQDA